MSDFGYDHVDQIEVVIPTDRVITARHALLTLMALSSMRQGVALCVAQRRSILGERPIPQLSFWTRRALASLDRREWPSAQEALTAQFRLHGAIAGSRASEKLMREPEFDLVFAEMSQGSLRNRMMEFNAVIGRAFIRVARALAATVSGNRHEFRHTVEDVANEGADASNRRIARGTLMSSGVVIQSVAESLGAREIGVVLVREDERPLPVPL